MARNVGVACKHPRVLYERLVTKARRRDGLDEVRLDAIEKARGLVDLLDLQRRNWTQSLASPLDRHEEMTAAAVLIGTRIDEWLGSCRADEQRRAAAVTLMLAADFTDTLWGYGEELALVVPGTRGWVPAEVAVLLAASLTRVFAFWVGESLGIALTAAETLDVDGVRLIEPWLRHAHGEVMGDGFAGEGWVGVVGRRLRRLLAKADNTGVPDGLVSDRDPWAGPLRQRLTPPTPELAELLVHLAELSGPRPTRKWRQRCLELIRAADATELPARCLRALAEGEVLCSRVHGPQMAHWHDFHHHYLVSGSHVDLARGTVWAAVLIEGPGVVADLAALALRTGGARRECVEELKLAGAAINALGDIEDPSALEALSRVQRGIGHRALRKQLDAALLVAAGRQGITSEQVVERSVPTHGLASGGLARELGEVRAVVSVADAATVRLTFITPEGREVRTAPAAVREPHVGEIKALKALVKEVRGTLSGERGRIEGLMAIDRTWTGAEWGRHYLGHPITGAVATSLIWEFARPDGQWVAAVPALEGLLTADGQQLPPPHPDTHVRLWHPIRATVTDVLAWREFLTARGVRQPFKQAFREIYLLTPAELETPVYSNRFAAHIVRYPRLYALFKERGWQANFLGRYDGGYDGLARRTLAEGEWRAGFYHESAQDDFDRCPDYAATDQVRFERRDGRDWRQVPLDEVPAVVFSEAIRDVDLFVGVTSIAGDPDWADRGEDRYTDYWQRATFGELTAGAEVRRDALSRVLPRTNIADRATVAGRYLTVRGDLRTYKIHLGSANILMEPDDSYLCIVPTRRRAGGGTEFLPFEDERLSLILSKAFLLAADATITDESILRQIKRGA